MLNIFSLMKSWGRPLDTLSRLCFTAAGACLIAGGLISFADSAVPLDVRGIGLIAVGCFFLGFHGLFDFAIQRWRLASSERPGVPPPEDVAEQNGRCTSSRPGEPIA
jgi:hypothetical protein